MLIYNKYIMAKECYGDKIRRIHRKMLRVDLTTKTYGEYDFLTRR